MNPIAPASATPASATPAPAPARSARSTLANRTLGLVPPLALTLALVLAAALAPTPALAQTPDPAVLDSVFAPWDREGSPGCAAGVYRDGALVLARGYGEANLDWGIPITPTTVFYSGSISKQFTAATAALLHLNGTLDLDADIRRYIPELPPYDPVVTVRHLVYHVSGVRDIYGLISLSGGRTADAWTDAEYLALIAAQTDLNFDAGTDYLYSNGGYYLLTTAIERSSGMRLDDAARELIFEPLGMNDTHFHQDSERVVPRRAMSYGGSANAGFRQTFLGNFDKSGAGGLHTTLDDMAAWDRNFITGELGGDAFLDLMQTRGTLNSGDTLSYAFGLQFGTDAGRRTIGHGGSFMGFRADYVRFPDEGLSVVALCNLGGINPGPLTRQVARAILGQAPTPASSGSSGTGGSASAPPASAQQAPAQPPSAPLRAYAGSYHSSEVGTSIEVVWTGSELRLRRPGATDTQPLEWVRGDRFSQGNWTIDFQVEDAQPVSLRLDAGRVRNLLYRWEW